MWALSTEGIGILTLFLPQELDTFIAANLLSLVLVCRVLAGTSPSADSSYIPLTILTPLTEVLLIWNLKRINLLEAAY